jgi:predicted CXXCH cytochrome family protein
VVLIQRCSSSMGPVLLLTALLMVCGVRAQDIDNVVSPNGRKPLTFLNEIENESERAAFLRLYSERKPARRRMLAEAFITTYPQSWLLAPVYEIAAKSSIDLDEFSDALRFARESLRLLPENPLLLVPVANLLVQQKAFAEAADRATEALEYLERFGRPASIAEREWPGLQAALRASGHFVLGTVAAAEGLGSGGALRTAKLAEAEAQLLQARELNQRDPEVAYLLGLVELSRGNPREGAVQFAWASRQPGPLQQKSLEQWNALKSRGITVAESGERRRPATPAEAVARPVKYSGSGSCRRCHSSQHAAWQHTGMARMFRAYRPENVIGNFERQVFDGPNGTLLARMETDGTRRFFSIRRPDGVWQRYPVDYTIGSKWQQAYATRTADGQIQVFPLQYNLLEKMWLNYWKRIDPPQSARANPDGFHNLSQATNYQINCAPCHTSQLGGPGKSTLMPQDLSFLEPGVNCEMCHGPSAHHVTAMSTGKAFETKDPVVSPVDFRRLDHRAYVKICAQCHMQSAMRELGPAGEYNYSSSGASFMPVYLSRPYVEFSRRAFYKDGRFRETTFIVEALMRSACYRRGQISCGSCHDPHPADAASNPVSLKFRDQPDQMCVQCHARVGASGRKHTHHAPESEGSRCVSCHMPRIMNSLLFKARTHQVDDIPHADMTERFGQEDSPCSCLLCHRDKDSAWLKAQLRAW